MVEGEGEGGKLVGLRLVEVSSRSWCREGLRSNVQVPGRYVSKQVSPTVKPRV